jgi:hypothetical protein
VGESRHRVVKGFESFNELLFDLMCRRYSNSPSGRCGRKESGPLRPASPLFTLRTLFPHMDEKVRDREAFQDSLLFGLNVQYLFNLDKVL